MAKLNDTLINGLLSVLGDIKVNGSSVITDIFKQENPISATSSDTPAYWKSWGNGISIFLFSQSGCLVDQPETTGFLINIVYSSNVHQIWFSQASGNVYHRGSSSTSFSGSWKELLQNDTTAKSIAGNRVFTGTVVVPDVTIS